MERRRGRWMIVWACATLLVFSTACALLGGSRSRPTATSVPASTEEAITPTPTDTVTPVPIQATPTDTPVVGGGGKSTPSPTVEPLCATLELEVYFHQEQSMQLGETSLQNVIEASGSVPLSVEVGAFPARVRGEGEIPITGGGHAGECVFQNSGSVGYRLEGELTSGPGGAAELRLRGQRTMNIVASAPCGGGGASPFEGMAEQVLPYRDGAAVEWDWDVPAGGVTGKSRWVLHILCEE